MYNNTYVGDPSKDVGVEADMILADIKSALHQNFFLESTTVIYFRFLMFKEAVSKLRSKCDGCTKQYCKVQMHKDKDEDKQRKEGAAMTMKTRWPDV